MTPQEKAKELVEKYKDYTEDKYAERWHDAKACAIIAVDEIINTIYKNEFWADYDVSEEFLKERDYWKAVKESLG